MKRLLLLAMLTFILLFIPTLAQRPDAPDYAQHGPYAVGTRDFTIEDEQRPLDVALWYPALNPDNLEEVTTYKYGGFEFLGNAIRDAMPAAQAAPFPVVLFSHGNAGLRYQSSFLLEHLASYGFIVAAIDHPTNSLLDSMNQSQFGQDMAANLIHRPQDIAKLYDFVLSLNEAEDFKGLIDTDLLAVTGHSFGGYTALSTAGTNLNFTQLTQLCTQLQSMEGMAEGSCWIQDRADEMLAALGLDTMPTGTWPQIVDLSPDALVLLAPWNGPLFDINSLAELYTPTLFMVGTSDTVTPPQRDAYFLYQQMTSAPLTIISLQLAGHYVFVNQCIDIAIQLGLFDQCSDPVWDMQRAHDLTNHFTTAFLLAELQHDNSASSTINGTAVIPGVDIFRSPGSSEAQFSGIQRLVPDVLERIEHDSNAWTQGLLLHDGSLYESTGKYGDSSLRRLDPATGEVLQIASLPEEYFGEGLTKVDDRLIQITWKEGTAFVYDLDTFDKLAEFAYEGEGWGICYDAEDLYMSNGSSEITRRDPETFEPIDEYTVTVNSKPIAQLNELECVGDEIYANVLNADFIVRFDKHSGVVNAYIDTREMRLPEEVSGNVLNGIAYDEENDLFYLTGKFWPRMYLVQLREME